MPYNGITCYIKNQHTKLEQALKLAVIESLKSRRLKLVTSFGKKDHKNDKHNNGFVYNEAERKTPIKGEQQDTRSLLPPNYN